MAAGPECLNRLPRAKNRDYAGGMPASSHSRSDVSLRIRVAPEEVAYRHWPIRQTGWSGWTTMAIVAVTTLLAAWASESVAMTALTYASLMLVTRQTWLPTWVEVGPSGVTQTVLGRRRRIPWTAIRQYEVCLHGVLLLPDEVRTPFSPLRGFYLHWAGHRSEVLANFEYYLQGWSAGRTTTGNESTELARPAEPN